MNEYKSEWLLLIIIGNVTVALNLVPDSFGLYQIG